MLIIAALFLDVLFGDPKTIFPHPVVGIGKVIRFWEKKFYPQEPKKRSGIFFCAAVLGTVFLIVGSVLSAASLNPWLYGIVLLYLSYSSLAWRSLKDESMPVFLALCRNDISEAREKLSAIVGRDTRNLNEADVVRATVETVGENAIDGVFSVLFYLFLGYCLGGNACAVLFAWLFKTASTLDSMVGYDDDRYRDFGYASAKLDDILNFIPARMGAFLMLLSGACLGYGFFSAFEVFRRDRKNHKSPNSAHGESVFAGLLGLRLGGGAFYEGVWEEKPFVGDDVRAPVLFDVLRSHAILDAFVALCALCMLFAVFLIRPEIAW